MKRRTRLLMAGSAVFVVALSACSADRSRFSNMNGEQLHSYNWDKPFAQQVSCQTLQTANSRIPKRRCLSNARWANYYDSGFARVNAMATGGDRPASGY